MNDTFSRTVRLIGDEAFCRLQKSHVTVVGIGGVGGHCAEALVRSGIGTLTFIDGDRVSESNLNRQFVALCSTIGHNKVDVMRARAHDINPDCNVTAIVEFFMPENDIIPMCDIVVDAIDQLKAKIGLVLRCRERGIGIISSMGAGNKLNPGLFKACLLQDTHTDPIARIMRRELKREGITDLRVVWSPELPKIVNPDDTGGMRGAPGSIAYVTAAAGLMLAGCVVNAIIGDELG